MTLQPLQTKEDITHGFSIPDPPGIPPTPTAADYRALLVKHRKTQLQNISTNLQRMAEVYDHAAEAILERVRALPDTVDRNGTGWLKAQLNLSRQVREELERLRADYGTLLDMSMISSAQDAADREAEVARLVGAPADPRLYPTIDRAASLMNGNTVAVSFGSLAKEAVEAVANRYYRDGLQLSQRLYRLSTETRQQVEDTILGGIADGSSARDLATRLQAVLSADGVQTPRYNAMRLARTEVNNAFRESVVKGVMDPSTGGMKSYVSGVKWNLSRSHARSGPDICDLWAAHDEGIGAGVYQPDMVPVDHPHGLCFLTTVLTELPDVIPTTMTMKPDVNAVPESQARYYAEKLKDPAAIAHLSRLNGA